MKKDEVIIRLIGKLDDILEVPDHQELKSVFEEILYNYDVTPKSTALATINNMQDKMMYYLASCKIAGLSDLTIKSYGRGLVAFSNDIYKNVEDITAMDIRMHLAQYAKTGVKNSTVASRTDILRAFFGWLHNEEYVSRNY